MFKKVAVPSYGIYAKEPAKEQHLCVKCNCRYPDEFFWPVKEGGLSQSCKVCLLAAQKVFWQDKMRKKCPQCLETKMICPNFYVDVSTGIPARNCKMCNAKYKAEKKLC